MGLNYFRCLFRVGFEGPVVVVPGAAEDDAVAARKHVPAAQITVVNLRLRQQHFQLPGDPVASGIVGR